MNTATATIELSDTTRASLQKVIETAVIDHASLRQEAGEEAANASRLVAASSAGVRICEGLQREAVEQARSAGRSWAELGALMGITRQAAQQRFAPTASKQWFTKEWVALHEGHEIVVRNSWTGGAKLFVDGEQVAENRDLFAIDKRRVMMSARVGRKDGTTFLVEIYAYALLSVSVKIVVDGRQIGGELF